MSSVWERFESIAKAEDVIESKNSFTPVEEGTYNAVLEELVATESQNGLPMLKSRFRLANNRVVFYNIMLQNINNPDMNKINVANACDFVDDVLGTMEDFTTLGRLAERVESATIGSEYSVRISYGKKDIDKKYTIVKILSRKEDEISDEDIPF